MVKRVLTGSIVCAAVLALAAPAAADDAPALTGIVLTSDRTVDATSAAAIGAGIWREGMNEQQKAYALWRFFIQRNMHKEAAPLADPGNAAELMTRYGYALCGTWGETFGQTAADLGLTATRVALQGHWIGAVEYWGDWHGFDADMADIYVQADGVVANPNDVRRLKDADGKWVLREGAPVKSYPWYVGPDSIKGVFGLYANVGIQKPYPRQEKRKWTYDLSLRPGAELSWSWYGDADVGFVCITHLPNVRTQKGKETTTLREYLEGDFDYYTQQPGKPKWSWGYRRGGLAPNPLGDWNGINGNGRLTYDLGRDGFADALVMAETSGNLAVRDGRLALADPAKPGQLVLDFAIPYPYGDAWIDGPLPAQGLAIELSANGKTYEPVWPTGKGVDDGQRIRLFDLVRGKSAFRLKFTLAAGAPPLATLRAVGAFHHNLMVLPGLARGPNTLALRAANADALRDCPLHATYVYDQMDDSRKVMRIEKTFTFTPDALTATIDTGSRHWPLMREIRLRRTRTAPPPAPPAEETGELDWAALPWDWVYHTVNFWNDFERGDRQGWKAALTSATTFGGSDFALDNSLRSADGSRQLKLIRMGCFLNRDSKFRCQLYVRNVEKLRFYSRNQGDGAYYEKVVTDLKDGQWQPLEVAFNDLTGDKDPAKKVQNNWFMANVYMQVFPAEGKDKKDVDFLIDNAICWDGELLFDPFADPEAPRKALAADPIWKATPPAAP